MQSTCSKTGCSAPARYVSALDGREMCDGHAAEAALRGDVVVERAQLPELPAPRKERKP